MGIFGEFEIDEPAICVGCRALLIIDADLIGDYAPVTGSGGAIECAIFDNVRARIPTDDEEIALLARTDVLNGIRQVAEYHAEYGSPHPNIDRPDEGKTP
jgi:hypothetical protein